LMLHRSRAWFFLGEEYSSIFLHFH
jgi:hypothetical protein